MFKQSLISLKFRSPLTQKLIKEFAKHNQCRLFTWGVYPAGQGQRKAVSLNTPTEVHSNDKSFDGNVS
jgi:hypothetical protein